MSAQLDALNTAIADLTTTANAVLDVVKNGGDVAPVQAALDEANAGIASATTAIGAVKDSLAAVVPAPAPAA